MNFIHSSVIVLCLSMNVLHNQACAAETSLVGNFKHSGFTHRDNLTITGNLSLSDQSDIQGKLTMVGVLRAENSRLNSVVLTGNAEFKHTTISGPASVVGKIHAEDSLFEKDLTVCNDKLKLVKSDVKGSVTLNCDRSDQRRTFVLCLEASKVSSVSFKNNQGEVYITSTDKVPMITGGKAIFQKCPF